MVAALVPASVSSLVVTSTLVPVSLLESTKLLVIADSCSLAPLLSDFSLFLLVNHFLMPVSTDKYN